MATFSELLADVYTITGRPDLVAETKLAVKAATLKIHQSDFYTKDLYESGIQWSTAEYVQQVDIKTIFSRFRALSYIRPYDATATQQGKMLDIIGPTQILDSYAIERTNVAYMSGAILNCKFKNQTQYVLAGMYLNPDITENSYSSWVAIDHPYAIVYEAAVGVFKQIGFDEQGTIYKKLADEMLLEVKMSNLIAVGY